MLVENYLCGSKAKPIIMQYVSEWPVQFVYGDEKMLHGNYVLVPVKI